MKLFNLLPLILFCGLASSGEAPLLTKVRQLTFEGKRAGEGYYDASGKRLIFQSERDPENPFYQIYLMDLESGDVERLSPGTGKTTCAWLHPNLPKALFASTHLDPKAVKKQKRELALRDSGKQRRYSWDYDEHYDLFEVRLEGKQLKRLTRAKGYDAEASWSPDGRWIVFASNRSGYERGLSKQDCKAFELDPAYMMDIYIMSVDDLQPKRLTRVKGYDGGPFFNREGNRICWRRFTPDGAQAEIYTMNIDGGDQRQLTKLAAMSWAPYFHPSGTYLIFTTNLHGFANFELYLVDAEGTLDPVRVTHTEGFDGLPVFSPDGKQVIWTSKRGANGGSQLFRADWNHEAALNLLGLQSAPPKLAHKRAASRAEIEVDDLKRHVGTLSSREMGGRMTGSKGERLATDYVASVFRDLGLAPAGDSDSFIQSFPFVAGISLGNGNRLSWGDQAFSAQERWLPLAFSKNGAAGDAPVVFAGYGIKAPARGDQPEYDSYVHLDVKDKWVMVFRYMPEDIDQKQRLHLNRFSGLRYKAMVARDLGARGLLVVSGPRSETKRELVALNFDVSFSGSGIFALSIDRAIAQNMLDDAQKDLETQQKQLDSGESMIGFAIGNRALKVTVDLHQERKQGRNVLARLEGDRDAVGTLIIGAHVDHLGRGQGGNSLAREDERGEIHFGADDNASGVAAVLEIAQYLADLRERGQLTMKHHLLLAAWSGEELGLLGSQYFVDHYEAKAGENTLRPQVIAYLNLDMVGRLKDNLVLQGLGSSPVWSTEIERRNVPIGLPISTQQDSYLPTDATSFYLKEVPILSAFTGSHEDYHSPRDTPEKLNFEGLRQITRLMALIGRGLLKSEQAPAFVKMARPEGSGKRANLLAYLGTIPAYGQNEEKGLKLSGVATGGPAELAGVQGGDLIIELGGKKIENIYDYTYAIEALKIGQPIGMTVLRGGKKIILELTPGSRD